jgi:hypothetical protein
MSKRLYGLSIFDENSTSVASVTDVLSFGYFERKVGFSPRIPPPTPFPTPSQHSVVKNDGEEVLGLGREGRPHMTGVQPNACACYPLPPKNIL